MGVYGCCPAYDTYFRKGISHYGIQATKDKHPAISELVNEIKNCNSFKTNIKKALLKLSANLSDAYTLMRVVDIVFWLKGKELIEEAKGEKNNDI